MKIEFETTDPKTLGKLVNDAIWLGLNPVVKMTNRELHEIKKNIAYSDLAMGYSEHPTFNSAPIVIEEAK